MMIVTMVMALMLTVMALSDDLSGLSCCFSKCRASCSEY